MTSMVRTQIYLPEEELKELHKVAKRQGKSVAQIVRSAVRKVWLTPSANSIVGLAESTKSLTSDDHDAIYDDV
jgi:metal-responsive CopG/Arc/MetJ family transcriptional regulator